MSELPPDHVRKMIEENEPGMPGPGGPRLRRPGMPGRPAGPVPVLKDILLKILTRDNSYDGPIAERLIKGELPDPSQMQHILDEAGRLQNLSEDEMRTLSELSQQM